MTRQPEPPLCKRSAATGRRGGFTLLELLIVTGLLASLAAFSWPSMKRSLARADRLRAVESVRAALAEARSRAVTRGRPHVLRFDERRAEMELMEVRFDEADVDQFQLGSGEVPVRRSWSGDKTREKRSQSSAVAVDGMPSREGVGLTTDSIVGPGPELELVESRELPAAYRCRERLPAEQRTDMNSSPAAQVVDSDSRSQPLADHSPAGPGVDANAIPGTSTGVVQLVYDVTGHTADVRLELCGPDGFCTPLWVQGALGHMEVGTPYRRTELSTSTETAEALP